MTAIAAGKSSQRAPSLASPLDDFGNVMSRRKTSDCRQLDVRQLQRDGLLVSQQFRFHWAEFDAAVNVAVGEDRINLSYRDRLAGGVTIYSIPIERTPCHLDGDRPWFACPTCTRRVAILYSHKAGKFACRTCHGLAYLSQSR